MGRSLQRNYGLWVEFGMRLRTMGRANSGTMVLTTRLPKTYRHIWMIWQKSKFIRKDQQTAVVRRLSNLQWDYLIDTAEQMANDDPHEHERTLFAITGCSSFLGYAVSGSFTAPRCVERSSFTYTSERCTDTSLGALIPSFTVFYLKYGDFNVITNQDCIVCVA